MKQMLTGIADLDVMDRAALVAAWSDVFASPAPKGISQIFLRRLIAFEIQVRAVGSLPKRVQAAVDRPAKGRPQKAPGLKPGGRLMREWNGVTHVVEVTPRGYAWNGRNWRSLSVIAREITGARWSGPRFFGLDRKAVT